MRTIYITVTVDWEGDTLGNTLSKFIQIRTDINSLMGFEVPMTHFICPNYWLKFTNTDTYKINGGLISQDEIGLHVHCWQTLVETSGVPFKPAPSMEPYGYGPLGRMVPLGCYSQAEIISILHYSKNLLMSNLPGRKVVGFRCGGWFTCDVVFEALMEQGFTYDASAVPPAIFSQGYTRVDAGDKKDVNGCNWGVFTDAVLNIWGYSQINLDYFANTLTLNGTKNNAITPNTQPYKIFNSSMNKSIIEIPDTCALADYVTADFMNKAIEAAVLLQKGDTTSNSPIFLSLGCHQESADPYGYRLLDFFKTLKTTYSDLLTARSIQFITASQAVAAAGL